MLARQPLVELRLQRDTDHLAFGRCVKTATRDYQQFELFIRRAVDQQQPGTAQFHRLVQGGGRRLCQFAHIGDLRDPLAVLARHHRRIKRRQVDGAPQDHFQRLPRQHVQQRDQYRSDRDQGDALLSGGWIAFEIEASRHVERTEQQSSGQQGERDQRKRTAQFAPQIEHAVMCQRVDAGGIRCGQRQ